MYILKSIAVLSCCLTLAACAVNRTASSDKDDYVEIDNPFITSARDAPATIWVPRSSVEGTAIPRLGEALKTGTSKISQSMDQSPPQGGQGGAPQQRAASVAAPRQAPPVAGPSAAQATSSTDRLKSRVAILELGHNELARPLQEDLESAGAGIVIDQAQIESLGKIPSLSDRKAKEEMATRLNREFGANVAVFVSAPEGMAPGKQISAELYDALGAKLLYKTDIAIPAFADKDQFGRNAAIAAAMIPFVKRAEKAVALLPWYSRIKLVEGNRAYIDAGKESGLQIGQELTIYRQGKIIEGLGMSPGEKVAVLRVSGFVGQDGSFAIINEKQAVRVNDMVTAE